MKTPSREIPFRELLFHEAFPSVSIFIGNDQPWPGNKRAMLALKGEIKRCKELLAEAGVSDAEAEQMLKPLEKWTEEGEKWKSVAQSLMIYLTKDEFRLYEIDLFLVDSTHVGHVYDIRPLIPLKDFPKFYFLELSQERVALHRVDRGGYETLEVPSLPSSFEEFNQFDDREKSLQHRSFQTTGSKDALFHGHGVVKDGKKALLENYAKEIAQSVKSALADKSEPLVVVGLAPLSSLVLAAESFGEVPFVWDKDPSSEPLHSLIVQVRNRYRDHLLSEHEEIVEEAMNFHLSRPDVESRVAEIVKRAHDGRIKQLFIRQQDYVWGSYAPENQEVEVLRARVPQTEDLLNRASIFTLRSGGEVYLFDSQRYQAPEHALAFLRGT